MKTEQEIRERIKKRIEIRDVFGKALNYTKEDFEYNDAKLKELEWVIEK